MEALFIYLLKLSISTIVLYLSYHFLLKRYKQFSFNRIYLLLVLPLSHIIPLIQIPVKEDLSTSTVHISGINSITSSSSEIIQQTSDDETFNWLFLLTLIYSIGIIIGLARFVLSYFQAYKIYKAAEKNQVEGQTVYLSEKNIRAFTFINKIIIGKNILHHSDLKMVIDHEKVHLREKHFIDLFMIELLSAFQWYNPATYLLNKAIRLNLEYQVDAKVVEKSNMRKYQMALISMVSDRMALPQFTELNSNNLKNRILMMKSPNTSKFSKLRKIGLLPIFLILLAGLSEKTPIIEESDSLKKDSMATETKLAKENSSNNEITTIDEMTRYFSKSLRYPEEARKFGQVGSVTLYFKTNNNGDLTGVYEVQPSGDVYYLPDGNLKRDPFKRDDIVIVGFVSNPLEKPIQINESNQHPRLYEECKRVIKDLPILNIEKLKGKTVEIEFRFKLKIDKL
ncbi:M56 family metallopeptidase [Cyclobacterium amurskyense]|uniref:M56 family metallopeptidase n=1 Tax=Cyclobacterium amurskyense TaxID=320787 RepID=UPI0030D86DF1